MSSQRFYTGDEQGLIKVITITEPQVVKVKRVKRNQPTPEAPPKPIPTIITWGSPDREKAIQLLCWDHGKKYLAVARKNGLVQLVDPLNNGSSVYEFKLPLEKQDKVDTIFVGLFANTEHIITCTNTGVLTVQSIHNVSQQRTFSIGKDICRMRVHPKEHHVVATAGKEQELTLWDLNELSNDSSENSTPASKEKKTKQINGSSISSGKGSKKDAPSETRYKSKETLANGQLFKAKNVKNDHLDLRVPIWNTDFQFLSPINISRIAVGTRYHQIRVYDTKSGARRPVVDVEIGSMPVVAMANGPNANEIVFSDTEANVYSVNTVNGEILGQFKGFTGVATALATFVPFGGESDVSHLVSVAMDRCLRVHDLSKTRKLLHKVYLKQRMTAVVVGEFTPAEPSEEEEDNYNRSTKKSKDIKGEEGDEDDEDIWESMGKLKEKKTVKKRKNIQ
ncbi:WD repeat-containing protein 74 [Lobosporangium transversale]|uniref:Ribosome biogenesis protein NSA1 n=1 Tax=Lobosporangium transversale TaxID=64571 RepID=A0A1Y2G5Q2_9FUNG|nr:WD40-repeat-containing domain protein [Lobosporangium transversale]KAF9907335.1 WD repeat-containing protein 74 [Lobosporangium transversale]ORY96001.1 WD40-repeat-containing domain protein [Lobosporangium transversale]|eukprot:XP_021875438.1 WD40-repeat-containing domain protein [Lobosporangium transversale]